MTDPLQVLIDKRAELGTKAVAQALGYSEVAIRALCTGHYLGKPDKILARVAELWIDGVVCPHIGESLSRADCQARAHAPKPFGGAAKRQWWTACQACANKGEAHG